VLFDANLRVRGNRIQITILRHGIPDLPEWGKVHASKMPEWINAYNAAGVKNSVSPIVLKMINHSSHQFIVCSNLKRSIHSAKIIGYQSPHLVDAVFREAELPTIQIPFIRLTPHQWSMVFRGFWFIGVSTDIEPLAAFKQRVSSAAEQLIKSAEKHDSVLLIGHGVINRFISKALISKGWIGEKAPNGNQYHGYEYWEHAQYTK
jgi:hypothetical protein